MGFNVRYYCGGLTRGTVVGFNVRYYCGGIT